MKYYGRLTLAAIIWGAVTFGAVYPWAYWPLVGVCALLGLIGFRAGESPAGWQRWLALTLALIGLGAAFQLVPLPRSLLLTLGPSTDRFLQQYILGYASNPPLSHPLSVAPQQTTRGLLLFLGFSVFLLGLIRQLPNVNLENMVRRFAIFATVMAVFAVVQKAVSGATTELVYGFWKPNAPGMIFGPFINRNHFAGWMLMAAPLLFGLALGHLERSRPSGRSWSVVSRWLGSPEGGRFFLPMLSALAMGASVAISGSRSGMASFAVAVVVSAAFVWRRFFRSLRGAVSMATVAAAVLVAVLWWAGLEAAVDRFAMATEDAGGRVAAWRDTARIIGDFPIFGVGLNAYGTAMLIYQSGDRRLFYKEAHNDYLQIVAEGGLLLALPAALAIGIIIYQVRQRFREARDSSMTRWIRSGAVAGLCAIAAQSAIEFSLQMPGNAALFLVLVAIAVHRPRRSTHEHSQQKRAA